MCWLSIRKLILFFFTLECVSHCLLSLNNHQPVFPPSGGQFLYSALRKIRIDSNSNLPTEKCFKTLSIDKPYWMWERQREREKGCKKCSRKHLSLGKYFIAACKKQSERKKKTTHSQNSYMRTQISSSVNEWINPCCFFFLLLLLFSLFFFFELSLFFYRCYIHFFFSLRCVLSVGSCNSLSFSLTIKTIALAIPFGLRDVRLAA